MQRARRLLATRGGERLAEAGVRALRRGDTSAAASLISRAVKLLPVDHPRRPELLTELASTLMRSGDFDRAAPVLDEAFESAVAIGDRRVELRTTIEREFFRTFTAPEGSALEDSSVADRTIPLLEELGDDRGLARAWLLKSEPEVNACRWGARAEALERALEHARRAGDTAEVAGMTFMHVQALYYGRTPVSEGIARCDEYLEEYPGDRLLEASVGTVLAGLRAMQGDFDEARSMYSRARAIHEELGRHFRIATVASLIGADIEQLAGQQSEAVAVLQWAYDTVREMGAMSATATLAGFLAEALAVDGRNAEAIEISEFADEHAPPSDIVTQALWRMARARGLAEKDPDGGGRARPKGSRADARDGLSGPRRTRAHLLGARDRSRRGAGRPAGGGQKPLRGKGQPRRSRPSPSVVCGSVVGSHGQTPYRKEHRCRSRSRRAMKGTRT